MTYSGNNDKTATAELQALSDEIAALSRRLAAAEADAVFAEAMENSSESIVIYDADGKLVACNQNFRDLYGYSPEEAKPGVHFSDLGRIDIERGNVVLGDMIGGGEDYLKRKAEYRRKLQGDFVVHLKDGRWIKTVDRRMQRGGFVSVQVDVTDMKKNEQALRAAKEAAEKAAQIKSEFLANISHDLRTPLNAILGFSEMILSEFKGPLAHDTYKDYITDINESGQLLLSMVNDILDTAKLESGKLNLTPENFDAITCSENVAKKIAPITAKRNLSIRIEKSDDFPETIFTDRRSTIQILNNLISNAAKHSVIGSEITIRWRKSNDNLISMSVTDSGAGISPKILGKIGEPFLQEGSYAVQSPDKGAGLGMYICKKLITAMGGWMEIESEVGRGTCVTMCWPADMVRTSDA